MRVLMVDAYVQKQVVTTELAASYAGFSWTPGARRALIEHARAHDADRAALRPRLGQVSVPAPIVWTDRDPYFPLAVGHELLGALRSARLVVSPNGGTRAAGGAASRLQPDRPGLVGPDDRGARCEPADPLVMGSCGVRILDRAWTAGHMD
jgi:hypothetical protein